MNHSLREFDLVLLGDVLPSPGPEVLEQTALGHVLSHDLQILFFPDNAKQANQVLVL